MIRIHWLKHSKRFRKFMVQSFWSCSSCWDHVVSMVDCYIGWFQRQRRRWSTRTMPDMERSKYLKQYRTFGLTNISSM